MAIIQKNSGVFTHYLTSCAYIEHFLEYRQIIWEEVEAERLDYSLLKSKDTVLAVQISQKTRWDYHRTIWEFKVGFC